MIEVLKHGKNYDTLDCPRCGCTIGFSGTDVNTFNAVDTYEGKELKFSKAFVRCPECGQLISLQGGIEEEKTETEVEEG